MKPIHIGLPARLDEILVTGPNKKRVLFSLPAAVLRGSGNADAQGKIAREVSLTSASLQGLPLEQRGPRLRARLEAIHDLERRLGRKGEDDVALMSEIVGLCHDLRNEVHVLNMRAELREILESQDVMALPARSGGR